MCQYCDLEIVQVNPKEFFNYLDYLKTWYCPICHQLKEIA